MSQKASSNQKRDGDKDRTTATYAERVNPIASGIVKALGHDIRRAILGVMLDQDGGKGSVSPNQISITTNEGLSQISYHVKVLLDDCKVIELVKTEPRRGAVEHFYRPTKAMREWLTGTMGAASSLEPAPVAAAV